MLAVSANQSKIRRDAARLLRVALDLLKKENDPFSVLAAARQTGISVGTPAWDLAHYAREAIGGDRDEHQLSAAMNLLESRRSMVNRSRRKPRMR